MDALDRLIEALGLPKESEEYWVKFNTKSHYESNPKELAKLLSENLNDYPNAVLFYLLERNQALENRVKELESKIEELNSNLGYVDSMVAPREDKMQKRMKPIRFPLNPPDY